MPIQESVVAAVVGQSDFSVMVTLDPGSSRLRLAEVYRCMLFGLNVAAGLSAYFILTETKGISLERMEKIFGGVDYVEAGECEGGSDKREALALDEQEKSPTAHVEDTAMEQRSGPRRLLV